MRIVAGRWRGRRIAAPGGRDVRPTSDRVREALFSSLASLMGPDLGGARVLDLFAGTGALALEALSRGASHAVLVERDPVALRAIRQNIEALDAGGVADVIAGDALGKGAEQAAALGPFALLMCDAPYRIEPASVLASVSAVDEAGGLTPDAVIVVEHDAGKTVQPPRGYRVEKSHRYGSTAVTVMRRRGGAQT